MEDKLEYGKWYPCERGMLPEYFDELLSCDNDEVTVEVLATDSKSCGVVQRRIIFGGWEWIYRGGVVPDYKITNWMAIPKLNEIKTK